MCNLFNKLSVVTFTKPVVKTEALLKQVVKLGFVNLA